MNKNDIFEMTCTSLGSNMEGICHYDGMAVFVSGMLPGETAPVRIVKTQAKYAFGILNTPPEISSDIRTIPDCSAYPKCGGCSARHMSYETSLKFKQLQVQNCFHSIAHMDLDIPPVLGMDSPYHYRNKSAFPLGGTKDQPVLGFFAPRSHRIIPVDSCTNAMEPTDAICSAFLDWMREHRISSYNEETHTGLLRHLIIRVNRLYESMVTVVARKANVPFLKDLSQKLHPLNVKTLVLNVNPESTNVILGHEFLPVYGEGVLHDQILGLDFELSPASFFQVNVLQTEKLYSLAVEFAELTPDQTVFDVYCGTGTISLLLARHCKHVYGIEVVPQAIENAKKNAAANHISNVSFYTGAAEDKLPELVHQTAKPDAIVVDPPRKGLDPSVIQTICDVSPSRVVYVSCNPATLARDVSLFAEKGYHIDRIQPVDMFCWTSDVETVCCLYHQKKDFVSVPYEPKDVEYLKE